MTSKIVVNNIEADSGVSTVTFGSNIQGNLIGNVTGTVNSSGIATFSSGLVVSAGSTSAPSISPSGDSNTGIFFPSADTIAFAEGGVEAARFDSSGRLGIGTINPAEQLELFAGSERLMIGANSPSTYSRIAARNTANSGYRGLQIDGSDLLINSNTSGNILACTGGGRLGIGTITPSFLTEIYSTSTNTYADNAGVNIGPLALRTINNSATAGQTATIRLISSDNGGNQNAVSVIANIQESSGSNNAALAFQVRGSAGVVERLRIDSGGRLITGNAGFSTASLTASTTQYANLHLIGGAGTNNGATIFIARNTPSTNAANQDLGNIYWGTNDGAPFARIGAWADGTPTGSSYPGFLSFQTTASGATAPTERMRIANNGKFSLNTVTAVNNGTEAWRLNCGASDFCARFFGVTGGGESQANCAMGISKDNSTNRSINAGGTINANGADYAEYMTKAGDFTIAKGDICGVDANGKLTNVFSDAVGFVVKSTNPSYVGGDTWGTEDVVGAKPSDNEPELLAQWEAALEAERQKVDRIAFAGQVPVNVTGANPGQYIVPVENNGDISGIAKDQADLTLAEYMKAVGKVIAIEDDGRARIIVKVA